MKCLRESSQGVGQEPACVQGRNRPEVRFRNQQDSRTTFRSATIDTREQGVDPIILDSTVEEVSSTRAAWGSSIGEVYVSA